MSDLYFQPITIAQAPQNTSPARAKEEFPIDEGHRPLGFKGGFVEEITAALVNKGKYSSPQGKIIAVYADDLKGIVIIDPKGKRILSKDLVNGMAMTYLGRIGRNGEFIIGSDGIRKEERAFIMIVDRKFAGDRTYLESMIAHELRHGSDYMTDQSQALKSMLNNIDKDCPANESKNMTAYYSTLLELRALIAQLDYFLANERKIPTSSLQTYLNNTVGGINLYFGYKNYIQKSFRCTVNVSGKTFNDELNRISEAAIPFHDIILNYNDALRKYGLGLNPRQENSPEMNTYLREKGFAR